MSQIKNKNSVTEESNTLLTKNTWTFKNVGLIITTLITLAVSYGYPKKLALCVADKKAAPHSKETS